MSLERPIKEIAKIGKVALLSAVGFCRNYKKESVIELELNAFCPEECMFKNSGFPCPEHRVEDPTIRETEYINERHRYKIKNTLEEKRLSKYQLKQFILYHYLNIDSNGFARLVSVKYVAEKLGCSIRTVVNNNRVLENLGLIAVVKRSPEFFNVFIAGYKQYHLKKEEGGTGYVQMPREFFEGLLKMNHANQIRMAIRKYLYYDNEVIVQKKPDCTLYFSHIKNFMPTNISYKKAILKTMEPAKEFFDIIIKDTFILFNLKDKYNGRVVKAQKEEQFSKEITATLENAHVRFVKPDIGDLVQLSLEYGLEAVTEALGVYKERYIDEGNDVDNLGGFIRATIRRSLLQRTVA